MGDFSPFSINIPVPRVSAKVSTIRIRESQLQRTVKNVMRKSRGYSQDSLQKYDSYKNPLQRISVRKDEIQLPFRLYAKEQDRINEKHRSNVTLQQKYKMTLSEYKSRLNVEDPPNDVMAVTDIDKGFFHYVNGRPLSDCDLLYKTLKAIVNNLLRTKLEIGYRHEHILNMETNHKNEMKIYEKSLKMFTEQPKYLDIFISEDYEKSVALLKKCDVLQNEVNLKIAELQMLADQQFKIVSSLLGLDYMYYIQQTYGRFLYYLSPPTWRARNRNFARSMEIELKGFDLGGGSEKTFNVLFEEMQKECVSNLVSPALYFTHPHELTQLFEFFEKQQLYYLENVGFLASHIKQAKEEIKLLKEIIVQDSATLLNTIKHIETLLEVSEEKSLFLEKRFYKIANGLFYKSTGAPEVMKLSAHLEFVYEKVFSEIPINVDIVTIVKSLESCYMYYCNQFDTLLSVNVKEAIKQAKEIEQKKLKRARHARKELFIFDSMKKRLLRAYEAPPSKLNYYKTEEVRKASISILKGSNTNKSIKPKKQKKNSIIKKDSLSETELEYLALFTNWCPEEDPVKYLHLE